MTGLPKDLEPYYRQAESSRDYMRMIAVLEQALQTLGPSADPATRHRFLVRLGEIKMDDLADLESARAAFRAAHDLQPSPATQARLDQIRDQTGEP